MTAKSDGARMAAGLKAIARLEAQRAAEARHEADLAAAKPAPPEIADRPGRAERRLAEAIRCPFCRALPGQQCHTAARGQRPMLQPHPSRLEAARAAANLSTVTPDMQSFHTQEGS